MRTRSSRTFLGSAVLALLAAVSACAPAGAAVVTKVADATAPAVVPPPAAAPLPSAADEAATSGTVARAVGCVGMTVSDADALARFYHDVLAFELSPAVELTGAALEARTGVFGARTRTVRARLGGECLDLTEFVAPRGRPIPVDARSNDRTFQHVAVVVRDMDRAFSHLARHKVEFASTGPQRLPDWNPNAGGIRAFYFKDPDHHTLEVIAFPPGKGDPRWRSAPGDMFLGIDHTAIVVGDTDASLAFYRDALGLRVAGTSENWGTEQEHLNNVFGARLRITTLRAERGPGVELLEYLAPRTGRPAPGDLAANDLAHWHVDLVATDVDALAGRARRRGGAFVSSGVVDLSNDPLGVRRAARVRDPDGHVLELAQMP